MAKRGRNRYERNWDLSLSKKPGHRERIWNPNLFNKRNIEKMRLESLKKIEQRSKKMKPKPL